MQFSPGVSMFARYGFRNLNTFDQPNIPLPSGGAGNGDIYARNRQLVLGGDLGARHDLPVRSASRLPWTHNRQEPAGPRLRKRVRSVRARGAALRQPHRGRPADASHQRVSDLGRQATNPQWQYPIVYNPKVNYTWTFGAHLFKTGYEMQRIDTEVQDVNPLCRPRHLQRAILTAGRRDVERPLQPRRLHAGAARPVRAQQRARRAASPQHAVRVRAGRLARGEPADDQPRPPLRILDALLGEGQCPVELRSGDQLHDPGPQRIDRRTRARQPRSEQFRAPSGLCVYRGARAR